MTLIDRLSNLDGPDREVDREIAKIDPGPKPSMIPFDYTASVDAAIALAERVLPGWGWLVQNCGHPACILVKDDTSYEVRGTTPAMALCIALLRAKEASPLGEQSE